jgi:thiazole synthase ThiGH ThiG subunit
MDADRAHAAMRAGAWAVAVVGAITRSADPKAAIAALQRATTPMTRVATLATPAFARTTLAGTASGA